MAATLFCGMRALRGIPTTAGMTILFRKIFPGAGNVFAAGIAVVRVLNSALARAVCPIFMYDMAIFNSSVVGFRAVFKPEHFFKRSYGAGEIALGIAALPYPITAIIRVRALRILLKRFRE